MKGSKSPGNCKKAQGLPLTMASLRFASLHGQDGSAGKKKLGRNHCSSRSNGQRTRSSNGCSPSSFKRVSLHGRIDGTAHNAIGDGSKQKCVSRKGELTHRSSGSLQHVQSSSSLLSDEAGRFKNANSLSPRNDDEEEEEEEPESLFDVLDMLPHGDCSADAFVVSVDKEEALLAKAFNRFNQSSRLFSLCPRCLCVSYQSLFLCVLQDGKIRCIGEWNNWIVLVSFNVVKRIMVSLILHSQAQLHSFLKQIHSNV